MKQNGSKEEEGEEEEAKKHIDDLKRQLDEATVKLESLQFNKRAKESTSFERGSKEPIPSPTNKIPKDEHSPEENLKPLLVAPYKCGYLCKWSDRAIGWGGTKWNKRFVNLEGGKLAYYATHTDLAPRYILSLKNCAVRDDGHKPMRRYTITTKGTVSEPVEGKFFYVFSIYQRPNAKMYNETAIVPLLRFSTPSQAEKIQWIDLISEACAYCDSDAAQPTSSASEWPSMRAPAMGAVPKAKHGTLAPIYFGLPAPPSRLPRHPSGNMEAKRYKSKSTLEKSAKSNPSHVSGYPPSRPMHRSANPSFLSEEASVQNFRGLLNLALIILVISNFRIIVDTMRAHGSIFTKTPDLSQFRKAPLTDFPFLSGFALLHCFIILTYLIELLLSRKILRERWGMMFHVIAVNLSLLAPMAIVWNFIPNPVYGAALLMYSTITWMKLISYAHANCDYRTAEQDSHRATVALISDLDKHEADLSYPKNVTLGNIYYFWFAPTLTYQIAFPRSPRVRWTKLAGIILRLVIATCFLIFLLLQVISPVLDSLVEELEKGGGSFTFHLAADYLLKLAIANTYVWLLIFYIFFHLFLNLCAEVLRFGDRVFYKDWWNSAEVSAYWRLWNMPVHYWLVRHVYFPCIRKGMSKTMATVAVFFVSAVMHEVLLSVPFHFVSFWSFIGMMGQIPLVAITKFLVKKIPGSSIGNIIFWLTFCVVGQPMAILLYTIDYWNLSFSDTNSCGVDGAELCQDVVRTGFDVEAFVTSWVRL
eukprot:CAMPEP_0195529628 /NCGR_PEP_ID=MMETSP0794_2-20130614/32244_1 /TAXON_ID=515487 /ORGANISM="Stephanopyxis turris, Strain CCMP 815" /LENGTH=757 /DNA_ID=CAMNT_0040660967 /DNA_START=180 /DNA_END=2453 /DNA_ORIENTATION=+